MNDKINHIEESEEKWYFFSAIKQSKELISSPFISKEYRLLTKEKLLSCIDICSKDNFDNILTINEILDIISDEVLFDHLSDKDKSMIYCSLWDNYFLLWDMELSLNSYREAFKYWNTEIYKKIIYMDIFMKLSYKNKDFINKLDITFSSIINSLRDNKEDIIFWNELEVDLGEFFVWWFDFINNPNSLQDYIYNLEVTEIKWVTELQLFDYNKREDFNILLNKIETILAEKYIEIAEEINHMEYIYIAFWNMVKRFWWEDIEYLEYWKQLKEFLFTWFQMINMYLNIWKEDEWLDILEFIVVNWFTNLSYANKDFLVKKVEELIKDYWNTLDDDRLNNILLNIVNNKILSNESMITIWNIFLSIWKFWNAYSFYYYAIKWDIDVQWRFKELLEAIVFEKNFWDISKDEDESHPKIIISILLKKINDWKKLNINDLDKIRNICNI